MKNFCLSFVLLLIVASSANARRYRGYQRLYGFINLQGNNIDAYRKHEIKEVDKFLYNCCYYNDKVKEKEFIKLQENYYNLLKKYPNEAHFLNAYYGWVNIYTDCPLVDRTKGFKMLLEAVPRLSTKEQAYASENIAYCYLEGIGTEKNAEKAFSYYVNACNLGVDVNFELAFLYLTGVGTPVNEEKAFYYFQNNYYTENTRGDHQSYEKMLSLILMEKKGLNKEAKACYINGLRNAYVYKKYADAVSCFEKAAIQGLSNAMFEIALLYSFDWLWENMKKKECKELTNFWFEKAASNGYFPAIFEQGLAELKEGAVFAADVEKGRNVAYPYFTQLAENGYDPAIYVLKTLYNNNKYESAGVYGNVSSGKLSVLGSLGGGNTEETIDKRECFGDIYIKDKFLRTIQKAMHGVE